MGYARHALRGSSLNSVVKIFTILVTIFKISLLARLLVPSDFGLFSLVAISLGIIEATTETGINTIILQSKKSVSYFLDTAWVIAILRGLIISILMIFLGFLMQMFYHEQKLFFLVSIASLVPLIKGFINPSIIILRKEFRFFKDSLYQFSLVVVDAIAAVLAAVFFHSVFAFLGGMLTAAIFEVTVSFLFFTQRPTFLFIPRRAKEIFHSARGLNISAALTYAMQNVDNLIIGKVVGVTPLGIYANAYSLSHRLSLEFAKSVQYGVFPIYVKILDERARLQRAFWKSTVTTLGVVTLISLPFFLFPTQIISVFLGAKWLDAVQILRPLIIAGIVQSFIALTFNVLIAKKEYFWMNVSLLMNVTLLIPLLIYFGSTGGLHSAVVGVLLSRILILPVVGYGLWQTLYAQRT